MNKVVSRMRHIKLNITGCPKIIPPVCVQDFMSSQLNIFKLRSSNESNFYSVEIGKG